MYQVLFCVFGWFHAGLTQTEVLVAVYPGLMAHEFTLYADSVREQDWDWDRDWDQ